MIEQIFYSTSEEFQRFTKPAFELAEALGKRFNIPVSEYNNTKLNQKGVLIGTNSHHHLAGGLSDLPLVVIDKHTDMYANGPVPTSYGYNTWVYYEIRKKPEVHLIIPKVDSLSLGRSCIPEGYEQKFHIYSLDGQKKARFFVLDDDGSVKREIEKEVEDLENLVRTSGPKQISTDFDFYQDKKSREIEDIIEGLIAAGNVYDFWLDWGIFQSDLLKKKKPFDRYIPIFQKIHGAE